MSRITAMAKGAVPNTLQRALSHWSSMAKAVITAKVTTMSIRPVSVRIPSFYHCGVSAPRKKD